MHPILTEHPEYKQLQATRAKAVAAKDAWDAKQAQARADYDKAFERAVKNGGAIPAEPAAVTPQQRQQALNLLDADVQNVDHAIMKLVAKLEETVVPALVSREDELLAEAATLRARLDQLAQEANALVATRQHVRKMVYEAGGRQHGIPGDCYTGRIAAGTLVDLVRDGDRFLSGWNPTLHRERDRGLTVTGNF
jgi:hypothetical protein